MSTATLPVRPLAEEHPLRQTWALSKRSILAVVRQPAVVAPSLIFPLFFAALGSSSFSRATQLPGFPPVDSFLQFSLAATIVQGVLFGSVLGATEMARDIENGFFERLLASPAWRSSIVLGRLAGSAVFGAVQGLLFTVILIPFGVNVESGVPGVIVIVIAGASVALAVGSFMSAMAIKTGSSEAVQGTFPLLFILLFLSSAFFPRETMHGVYKTIASLNPVSYIVEGIRELVISDFSFGAAAEAVLLPLGIAAVGTTLCLFTLKRRLADR